MQIVGYFLVEDRVQQAAPELGLGTAADAAWEAAVAALKAQLEGAFEGATAAAAMLTVRRQGPPLCWWGRAQQLGRARVCFPRLLEASRQRPCPLDSHPGRAAAPAPSPGQGLHVAALSGA